jgi:hypothetical protein
MRNHEVSATLADGVWLTKRYVTDLASIRDIAGELGCSKHTVTKALIRQGIPRRPVGWPTGDGTQDACLQLRDGDFLLGRYVHDRMTIQQVADLVGCGVDRVREALREHEIPVRWVGRRNPLPVDGAWLTRRYVTGLASIRDIAGELDLPLSAVREALIRHGITRRPVGTPKGVPSRQEQVARLRQLTVQQLHLVLVEADTESDAAMALGVSQIVLSEVAADAGIDREQAARERRTRKRIAAWPALLRDRDGLAEALDTWGVPTLARVAGCSVGLVRAAADHHDIRLAERAFRRGPRWTHQLPAPLALSGTAEPIRAANPELLNAANATRTQAAAARAVDQARDMLRGGGCPVRHRAVLQARVDHPQASLAELGAMFGTSKDAYAAMLRRALASRRSGQPLPAAPCTPQAQATTIQPGPTVLTR